MSEFSFTTRQRQAIETIDRGVMVTAAAGSGKTAVLAERCAHLVCDLEPRRRCGVDSLLVVTFTEAAAAEMKSRILEAIRGRLRANPGDAYLRTQAALIDTAQISTLHAFCLWMLRRWFNEASIDPTAAVLQEEEARLLRGETIDAMFSELYESGTPLGRGFVRLVDEYGLGRDQTVAAVVAKLAEFLRSLPDPETWLTTAGEAVGSKVDETLGLYDEELGRELARQRTYVEGVATFIEQHLPTGAFHGAKLRQYADALARWWDGVDVDAVRAEIVAFQMSARGAPRKHKDESPGEASGRELAKALFEAVRERRLRKRLQRLARFSTSEAGQGLAAIAPHVETLCGLAAEFSSRYQQAKANVDALDFSDLERGAYDLLRAKNRAEGLTPIAEELHERFAHVLVDEFQDINPLQEAILHLASRESDPARKDNLFCVGDVKQSIYRFRLADPELFQARIDQADRCGPGGPACVHLQENFRSSPSLIDGINLLFERLMTRETGAVDYDESARLRAGLQASDETSTAPIELHLLQRRVRPSRDDADGDGRRQVDPGDPAEWEVVEREAYLIGQRVLELRSSGMTVDGRAVRWSDMAILLRAATHTAQPMADLLGRMGVPTYAEAGDALLGATEVQDILALLAVLDNPQQDIPLASVLRSGVTASALNEDDLAAIRCIDREIPFHEAVRRYARQGDDGNLVERLSLILDRIARWRRDARRRPVADVLWHIYRESGFLAYVGGLTQGRFRRANLLALHQRARQFGGFRRQGLHRFLRFIESLDETGQGLRGAPPLGQAQDAVRVMSIHRSKGLEFPVVFVADLGRRFNLTDARGRIIFDRRAGIGLRVIDASRMIEYPSIQHLRVARAIESNTRDEELRILYVALTRAKHRLVLVGSADLSAIEGDRALWSELGRSGSVPLDTAVGTPLEWMVPALASAKAESVQWSDQPATGQGGAAPLYRVTFHTENEMREWHLEAFTAGLDNRTLSAAARLEQLPDDEPSHAVGFDASAVLDRLDYPYPHLPACSVRAVVGASEAKRAIDPFADEHQPAGQPHYHPTFDPPSILTPERSRITPQERGTLTHRVLEHVDLGRAVDDEVRRLVQAGLIAAQEAEAIDTEALSWFAGTPLGQRVVGAGLTYRREVAFISAVPASVFDPALEGVCDDSVLVRGIVDGVLAGEQGPEIIDFKTDVVRADGVAERVARYEMQMRLYARAISGIWRQPVGRCWLVFLTPRRIIEIGNQRDTS